MNRQSNFRNGLQNPMTLEKMHKVEKSRSVNQPTVSNFILRTINIFNLNPLLQNGYYPFGHLCESCPFGHFYHQKSGRLGTKNKKINKLTEKHHGPVRYEHVLYELILQYHFLCPHLHYVLFYIPSPNNPIVLPGGRKTNKYRV